MKKVFVFFGIIIVVALVVIVLFFSKKTDAPHDLTIVFNKSGNVSEYKTTGFSQPESSRVWTDGEEAEIFIPLFDVVPNHFLHAAVEIEPFLAKKIKKQTVDVYVNGNFITKWNVNAPGIYTFDLPYDFKANDGILNIKFKIDSPKSPKELNLSDDARKLGISVKNLVLSQVNMDNPKKYSTYIIGEKISFRADGNSRKYIGTGWSLPEPEFTWTDGSDAYLNMYVKNLDDKKLQLNIFGYAIFDSKDKCQNVTVYINDQELTTWCVGKSDDNYSVEIPNNLIANGAIQVKLHINKPFVADPDPRHLGMNVKTVNISQIFAAKTKIKVALWIKNKVLKLPSEKTDAENTKNSAKK